MTRTLSRFARAAVSGAVLVGVLAMHALTMPSPAGSAMSVESITGMPAIAAEAHPPQVAPTHLIATALSGVDASMCGHPPCVAILPGHAHSPTPVQPGDVDALIGTLDPAGVGDAGPLPLQRAPPPGAVLTRLCISRT